MDHRPEVLIVEDDGAIQSLLAALVMRNGIRPVLAADGTSALALLATRDFAVIVLDLFLPETNGFEVLRHISCLQPDLLPRIIVTTAASEATYRDCAYLASVWKVVRKPFDIEELEGELLACAADRIVREEHPTESHAPPPMRLLSTRIH
jgi:CheY-like chemotaxis protein